MLYLAYDEPDWDGINSPTYPIIYGVFTSIQKIVEYLAAKPLVGYEKYPSSCYVILVREDEEISKNYGWFDGVFVSGGWLNSEYGRKAQIEAMTETYQKYNANLSPKS